MKKLFAITITTHKDYSGSSGFFLDDGTPVGRILHMSKVQIDPNETLYCYDIESSKEIYDALKSGKNNLYRVSNYAVDLCSTVYVMQ